MRNYYILFAFLACICYQPLKAQNTFGGQKVSSSAVFTVDQSFFGEVMVQNLANLNTRELEMCPMPYAGGIVFTATYSKERENDKGGNAKKKFTDLYFTQQAKDGTFMTPVPLAGEVNGPLHDGMACFTTDGKVMYFTRNNKNGKSEDGTVDLKICRAEWVKNEWTNVKDLPFNSKSFSNCHPSLSADNQKMYFASNRPGGYGGMDIYVSTLKNGKWQDPVNMGSSINTNKNEIFPFAGPDGNLYFSSNGHPGEGGLDIFLSLGPEMGNWGRVENLGPAFNSPSDDFGFITNTEATSGYFSSSRSGGLGRDDIYQWELRDTDTPLSVQNNKQPLRNDQEMESLSSLMANMDNKDNTPNSPIPNPTKPENESFFSMENDFAQKNQTPVNVTNLEANPIAKMTSNNNPREAQSLTELMSNPSTVNRSNSNPVNTSNRWVTTPISVNIIDEAEMANNRSVQNTYEVGQVFRLENIYYDFDMATLKPESMWELEKLARFMVQNPSIEITILSHTDSRGNADYNFDLSQRRAESVLYYLTSQNISRNRIKARGYGENKPINTCYDGVVCSDEQHAQNRRTEFQIDRTDEQIRPTDIPLEYNSITSRFWTWED